MIRKRNVDTNTLTSIMAWVHVWSASFAFAAAFSFLAFFRLPSAASFHHKKSHRFLCKLEKSGVPFKQCDATISRVPCSVQRALLTLEDVFRLRCSKLARPRFSSAKYIPKRQDKDFWETSSTGAFLTFSIPTTWQDKKWEGKIQAPNYIWVHKGVIMMNKNSLPFDKEMLNEIF